MENEMSREIQSLYSEKKDGQIGFKWASSVSGSNWLINIIENYLETNSQQSTTHKLKTCGLATRPLGL